MIEMEPLIPNYQLDHWEFPRDRLTVTTVLGAGAFGVVMRGLAEGIKGSVGNITVAVKTVRGMETIVFILFFSRIDRKQPYYLRNIIVRFYSVL